MLISVLTVIEDGVSPFFVKKEVIKKEKFKATLRHCKTRQRNKKADEPSVYTG